MQMFYEMLLSLLQGTSMFFVSYFTCWLFFSKRLNFLESKKTDFNKFFDLENLIHNYKTDVYVLELKINEFKKKQDEFELKSDILNRISKIEGQITGSIK
jgi:hypothetical protein